MSRIALIAFASIFLGFAAFGQGGAPALESSADTRAALEQAVAARDAAAQRSSLFESQAQSAEDEAERAARERAALAARIQQAEAGVLAAEARAGMIAAEQASMREQLGQEREPLVRLTAALQQFSRRPASLSILRPGDIQELVYLRAIMSSTAPVVQERTSDLRAQMARSQALAREADQAAQVFRTEQGNLTQRRGELAQLEQARRAAAQDAGTSATREAERALALGEQARDLDALVAEIDRAGTLRQRLAALPGPVPPPQNGVAVAAANAGAQTDTALPAPPSAQTQPSPYILPANGRLVTGFGAPQGAGLSQGLTLAVLAQAQVVAPADGRIGFAGPYRGYGQIVIIEHAGGWTSLITNLARHDVSVGEEVLAGAPIGLAAAESPAIGLELRRNGQAVNPLEYTQ